MSYLNTPRICFVGNFLASAPTRNNLLAALDDPALLILKPGWDFAPLGNGDFVLQDCKVSCAWDAAGKFIDNPSDDPIIASHVFGAGKMADLDPEHRRVTDLNGMSLAITLSGTGSGTETPGAGPSGILETTPLRDYWENLNNAIATVWQSVLHRLVWSGEYKKSKVLEQLKHASPERLSVRLTPMQTVGAPPGSPPGSLTGVLLGVIGPHAVGEPAQFVAARRLITQRGAGLYSFPVASCLVDEARKTLVVDLSNLPITPEQSGDWITDLSAAVLEDESARGSIKEVLGRRPTLNSGSWKHTGGLVEWALYQQQLKLLEDRRLRVTFLQTEDSQPPQNLFFTIDSMGPPKQELRVTAPETTRVKNFFVMEEHPSGKYVDVDCRSIRLNPGESTTLGVYARHLGKPLAAEVIDFHLHRQLALAAVESILPGPSVPGYPEDPGLPINSEPREVLFDRPGPLRVTTDRNGYAELTIRAKPGQFDLLESRQTIDSQLYYLGDPEQWQAWGAFGPHSGFLLEHHRVGASCALAVLVFNTHDAIADPTWDDIEPWLTRYADLYPVMITQPPQLNLGIKNQVDRNAVEIARRLSLPRDDVGHMPISRDLSKFRLETILAYLRSVTGGP
jgi:hypothetical protein